MVACRMGCSCGSALGATLYSWVSTRCNLSFSVMFLRMMGLAVKMWVGIMRASLPCMRYSSSSDTSWWSSVLDWYSDAATQLVMSWLTKPQLFPVTA